MERQYGHHIADMEMIADVVSKTSKAHDRLFLPFSSFSGGSGEHLPKTKIA